MTRKRLFVGGPLDGQRLEVEETETYVMYPAELDAEQQYQSYCPEDVPVRIQNYVYEPMHVAASGELVFVCTNKRTLREETT